MIGELLLSYRKYLKIQNWRILGLVTAKNVFAQKIAAKIFGKNYRNTVNLDKKSKIQYLILRMFWQLLPTFNIWKKELELGCVSTLIWHFFNISCFPTIQRLKSLGNSCTNSCTKFTLPDIKHCFTLVDSGLTKIIKKCQNIIFCSLLFQWCVSFPEKIPILDQKC